MQWHKVLFALQGLLFMAGCQSIGDPGDLTSDSLLQAASTAPDAVTLDIYWARTDIEDEQFASTLWQSVQEDRIPVEVRRALADDGLRAGVVGGTPTEEIMRLLNPDGVSADQAELKAEQLSAKPAKVTRRLRQLRPGHRLELQAAGSPRTFPLLRGTREGLVGQTFPDAQGIYAVEVVGRDGKYVELELSPELHHGQPHMKYTPSGPGMVVQKLARDVEAFAELRTRVQLAPGEILVVTSLPNSDHRLGGLFHHATDDTGPQKKYLLVRVSQAPSAESLASKSTSAWPWQ